MDNDSTPTFVSNNGRTHQSALPPLPPYDEWPDATPEKFVVPNVFIDHYMALVRPSSTLIFGALCRHRWPADGKQRPTVPKLAKDTGLSQPTVINALAQLQDYDLIPRTSLPQHRGVSSDLRWQVWDEDDFTCVNCGSRRHLTVDHVVPVSKGGTDDRANLQTLCRSCNSRKGAR